VGLHVGSVLAASFYAYYYVYDSAEVSQECAERPETTLISVYLWLTEMTFSLAAPLTTVVLNVMVIRRLRRHAAGARDLGCTRGEQQKKENIKHTVTS